MAAHCPSSIRVRLHFDYPPPAVVDCRMCWLLVDLNTCRVVADLESTIREKFEFSRRSILKLFIDDCYLPHTEGIDVVRDNDNVRVKVEYLAQVNGHSGCQDKAREDSKKRPRTVEEVGPDENGVSVECKKKKRRKGSKGSLESGAKQTLEVGQNKKSPEKKKKKKKKKKKTQGKSSAVIPKSVASTNNTPVKTDQPVKSTKKPPVVKNISSDSSGSSSEEDEVLNKKAVQKPASIIASISPTSPKAHPPNKPFKTKPQPQLSSSSQPISFSNNATSIQPSAKKKPSTPKTSNFQPTSSTLQTSNTSQKQAGSVVVPPPSQEEKLCPSSSEEEIEFVIHPPVHQSGLGARWHGSPGTRGRIEGRGGISRKNAGFEPSYNGAVEPSYQTDSLTNTSVVLQNGAESAPKPDYSSMPLLAAPPQVGQKIAFKLLELTENYTPQVSEYKEGKIVNFDHTTKQIELELQNISQAPTEPGKFDLVYQNPDGSERVEYAVSRDSRVTERWDSLLEPRLII